MYAKMNLYGFLQLYIDTQLVIDKNVIHLFDDRWQDQRNWHILQDLGM